MKTQEELYNDTPSSFRHKEIAPFLKAEPSNFWLSLADILFGALLKQNFAAIRIKDLENLGKRNVDKPNIIYAPHICWWDGILAYYLCRKIFNLEAIGMMEDLHAMPIFQKIGAFSVDKKSPKVILESLTFAKNTLNSPHKALYLYPQGIIRPQDYPQVKFSSGVSYIASNLEGVNLIPLAVRYCFLRANSPEILIEVNEPIFLDKIDNRNETTENLKNHFEQILEKQRREVANGQLEEYIPLFRKKGGIICSLQKILNR